MLSLLLLVLLQYDVERAKLLLLCAAIIIHHLIVRGVLRVSRWEAR